jgi:hypothetical protein
MSEIWKEYVKDSRYKISTHGRVQRDDKCPFFPANDSKGYPVVNFRKNGNLHRYSVHRMVAETFIPNPQNLAAVNHKDNVKTNNNLDNLEWISIGDNIRHAAREFNVYGGEKSPRATMDEIQVLAAITCFTNPRIKYCDIAKAFSTSGVAISHMARGNSWKRLQALIGFIPARKQIKGRKKIYIKGVGKRYPEDLHV